MRDLETLQSVDGARHPELPRVAAIFAGVSTDLEQHMLKEEQIAQFERDLHRHVSIENNVLFPKTVELEQQLMSS